MPCPRLDDMGDAAKAVARAIAQKCWDATSESEQLRLLEFFHHPKAEEFREKLVQSKRGDRGPSEKPDEKPLTMAVANARR
jgi:hypothetical protein